MSRNLYCFPFCLQEVSTGSNNGSMSLTVPGVPAGDLPPLPIPRSNSSVIKEQLDQLVDREMEQLKSRASSSGERDMPSRPMSRRVSASKAVTSKAPDSKVLPASLFVVPLLSLEDNLDKNTVI